MIGVIVTFAPTEKFDPTIVTKIAAEASGMFEGMPGLRPKFFTLDEDASRARGTSTSGIPRRRPEASSPTSWSSASPASTA